MPEEIDKEKSKRTPEDKEKDIVEPSIERKYGESVLQDKERAPEKEAGEPSIDEIVKLQELYQKAQLSEDEEKEAEREKHKILHLEEEKKISHLLDLVESRGLKFAFVVVKKLDDPYILDRFHDELAKEERFKKYI